MGTQWPKSKCNSDVIQEGLTKCSSSPSSGGQGSEWVAALYEVRIQWDGKSSRLCPTQMSLFWNCSHLDFIKSISSQGIKVFIMCFTYFRPNKFLKQTKIYTCTNMPLYWITKTEVYLFFPWKETDGRRTN